MTSGPPPRDHIVPFSLPTHASGILPDRMIAAMADDGLIRPAYPFVESQIQPASLDLRLGDIAYRVRASFLPGPGATVAERIDELKLHEISLADGAVLETNCVYIVPLLESLALPQKIVAAANPKSSTGRLDVFTRVIADETRPLLQGLRLTAYEAARAGLPYAVLPDGAAGSLFARGEVDLVVVGADRIAGDGSVANKVGTYPLAVLAHHHRVPFVVVAPTSTVDTATPSGREIVVEHRDPVEVTRLGAPGGAAAYNPAFDVTPPELVTALVTERGVASPVDARTVAALVATGVTMGS